MLEGKISIKKKKLQKKQILKRIFIELYSMISTNC